MEVRHCRNRDEAQALANFLWNEQQRHWDDIDQINNDLAELKEGWGVEPIEKREFIKP